MLAAIIIMPLEGIRYSDVNFILPIVILAICFVAFGKKQKGNP